MQWNCCAAATRVHHLACVHAWPFDILIIKNIFTNLYYVALCCANGPQFSSVQFLRGPTTLTPPPSQRTAPLPSVTALAIYCGKCNFQLSRSRTVVLRSGRVVERPRELGRKSLLSHVSAYITLSLTAAVEFDDPESLTFFV